MPPICPETQKTQAHLCPVALCCTEGLSVLLGDLLCSRYRRNHSDHRGLEGPMIHNLSPNLKVDRGSSLKTRVKGAVLSQTLK